MTGTDKTTMWQAFAAALACGRTVEEQVESIKRCGNHGATPILRAAVLASHGIAKPKAGAENCIILGCYRPFNTPFIVRDYLRLIDVLGIDYTYLEQEYCCGAPLVSQVSGDQFDSIITVGKNFMRQNYDLAQQKGAVKLAYCCSGCASAARNTFTDMHEHHVYMPDLILDSLESHDLKISPSVMGYFEGCHTFVRSVYPAGGIGWARYRQRLNSIEGLKIVDLPHNICCKKAPDRIIEHAEKANLDKILCACSGCYWSLTQPAKGKVQLISLPELFLQSLGG